MWFLFVLAAFLFFLIPREVDELEEEDEFLDEILFLWDDDEEDELD